MSATLWQSTRAILTTWAMSKANRMPRASSGWVFLLLQGCGARTGLDLINSDDVSLSDAAAGANSNGLAGKFGLGGAATAQSASRNTGISGHGSGGSPGEYATGGRASAMSAFGGFNTGGTATGGRASAMSAFGGFNTGGTATGSRASATSAFGGFNTGGTSMAASMSGGFSAGGNASSVFPFGGSSTSGGSGATASGGSADTEGALGGSTAGGNASSGTTAAPLCAAADTGCRPEILEGSAGLCNDLDDDCDGIVDEGCPCTPGAVKPCFAGPPGRRGVGACSDGLQACETNGALDGTWGSCVGGITPQPEVCDDLDNDCNGCRDEIPGCIPFLSCPGPGDPRIPVMKPFSSLQLNAREFYDGDAYLYAWSVEGGPCDQVAPTSAKSFDLLDASSSVATFTPRLSGDYTISLAITTPTGELYHCEWIVPVRGPGLRIEMCYPESDHYDLDLYLKRLSTPTPWFTSDNVFDPNLDECAWHNCEAELRGYNMNPPRSVTHPDWGYANSPLSECVNGPLGSAWANLGYCPNPRLDVDNNLDQSIGLPENINIDQPGDGDGFRVMVQNFQRRTAHPIVNVYCGGDRIATFGAPPDALQDFSGQNSTTSIAAMWRVTQIVTHLEPSGSLSCEVTAIHPPGSTSGYFVTTDDPSF
jgi:hypothetical protein